MAWNGNVIRAGWALDKSYALVFANDQLQMKPAEPTGLWVVSTEFTPKQVLCRQGNILDFWSDRPTIISYKYPYLALSNGSDVCIGSVEGANNTQIEMSGLNFTSVSALSTSATTTWIATTDALIEVTIGSERANRTWPQIVSSLRRTASTTVALGSNGTLAAALTRNLDGGVPLPIPSRSPYRFVDAFDDRIVALTSEGADLLTPDGNEWSRTRIVDGSFSAGWLAGHHVLLTSENRTLVCSPTLKFAGIARRVWVDTAILVGLLLILFILLTRIEYAVFGRNGGWALTPFLAAIVASPFGWLTSWLPDANGYAAAVVGYSLPIFAGLFVADFRPFRVQLTPHWAIALLLAVGPLRRWVFRPWCLQRTGEAHKNSSGLTSYEAEHNELFLSGRSNAPAVLIVAAKQTLKVPIVDAICSEFGEHTFDTEVMRMLLASEKIFVFIEGNRAEAELVAERLTGRDHAIGELGARAKLKWQCVDSAHRVTD